MAGHKTISDEELRARLAPFYENNGEFLPPIIDATRSLLLAKLARLEHDNQELEIFSNKKSNNVKLQNVHVVAGMATGQPEVADAKHFKTLVFFDLEATGLPSNVLPPRITELCLRALDLEHFLSLQPLLDLYKNSEGFESISPRVINSLNLCFNPGAMISDQVTDLTGLSNDLLANQSTFQASSGRMIQQFLDTLPKPLCLIAHNGSRFDFPLLQAELHRAGVKLEIDGSESNVFILDSLKALKTILTELPEPKEENWQEILKLENNFEDDLMDFTTTNESNEVKKPRLQDEDELHLLATTPEKNASHAAQFLAPPPTEHTSTRRRTSELLSLDRRKNGAKIKKKLDFQAESEFLSRPKSFSLPKLHQHLFGLEPRNSHGAEVDVKALIRVCACKAEKFVQYAQTNFESLANVSKMW